MSMKALNIAQIIVFGPLLAPAATYCFWKHGRSGFLGWVAVVSFCTVRALGAALMYHDEVKEQVSLSSTIVSNLGITPLLMASAGLLHESGWNFTSSATGSRRRMRFFIKALAILSFHVLVLMGIFLILKHATALKDVLILGRVPADEHSDLSTAKIGFGVLVFAWVVLVLWTILHWVRLPSGADSSLLPEKTLQRYGNDAFVIQRDVMNYQRTLLTALTISLPSIGLPICFSMYCFGQEKFSYINDVGYKAGLNVAPQMIVGIIWIATGLYTRNLNRLGKMLA